MTDPDLGSRRLVTLLARDCGIAFKRKHVEHLCREVGIAAGSGEDGRLTAEIDSRQEQ
jgi:hypothetical protein